LEKRGKILGIEVKSGNTQNPKGVTSFIKQNEPDKILLVENSGLPWEEFLKIPPLDLFR
jgi:hypothetical protein